jgi:hypothetical protein
MALAIQPFDAARTEAVKDFNRRMAAGGSSWRFPESPVPSARARGRRPVFQEFRPAARWCAGSAPSAGRRGSAPRS